MGWFEDIWNAISTPPGSTAPILAPDTIRTPAELLVLPVVDDSDAPEDIARAKRFLAVEAALLGGIVAAPAAYVAYTSSKKRKSAKKRKGEERVLSELSDASTRATSLLSAFGPAFAIPATYITVQGLENAKYISKGLGDAVQTMLTASAAAGLVGGIAGMMPFLKK